MYSCDGLIGKYIIYDVIEVLTLAISFALLVVEILKFNQKNNRPNFDGLIGYF
jgi:hypothetical protein